MSTTLGHHVITASAQIARNIADRLSKLTADVFIAVGKDGYINLLRTKDICVMRKKPLFALMSLLPSPK